MLSNAQQLSGTQICRNFKSNFNVAKTAQSQSLYRTVLEENNDKNDQNTLTQINTTKTQGLSITDVCRNNLFPPLVCFCPLRTSFVDNPFLIRNTSMHNFSCTFNQCFSLNLAGRKNLNENSPNNWVFHTPTIHSPSNGSTESFSPIS